MPNLLSKKGIFLISALTVASFLSLLSTAYVISSIIQANSLTRQEQSLGAMYAAERGIAYAFIEAQNNGFNWFTHTVDTVHGNVLVKAMIPPAISLSAAGAVFNAEGSYVLTLPTGTIEIKTYLDPVNRDVWLLARAEIGGAIKIIRYRLNSASIYQYFYYFPSSVIFDGVTYNGKGVGGIHVNRAQGAASGDIRLRNNTVFRDLAELSCEGYIYYDSYQYSSPRSLDGGDVDGLGSLYRNSNPRYEFSIPDGSLTQQVASRFYGNDSVYFWIDDDGDDRVDAREKTIFPKTLPSANNWEWDKYSWSSSWGLEKNYSQSVALAIDRYSENSIPVSAPDTSLVPLNPLDYLVSSEEYNNEYKPGSRSKTVLSRDYNIGIGGTNYSEYQVYRYITGKDPVPAIPELQAGISEITTQGYWTWWKERNQASLPGDDSEVPGWERTYWEAYSNWTPGQGQTHQTGPSSYNPEWWQDLEYGSDMTGSNDEFITVDYLNSKEQLSAWQSWLQANELDGIVQEKNTGGRQVSLPAISTTYSSQAMENGLYIGDISKGEIYLNGQKLASLPAWVNDNVEFFNAVRYDSPGSIPQKENVLQIDIDNLITSYADQEPANGIVYVADKNVRLVNGSQLPANGLTVVSPRNVFIKGSYNTDDSWQPSSVICNGYVYLLSNDYADPQELPYLENYYPTPTIQQLGFLQDYCWDAYPSGVPKPADQSGLTWSWVQANLTGPQQALLCSAGEGRYDLINESQKANRVQNDTEYKVSIIAPNPAPQVLERWYNSAGVTRKMTIEGAFIQLERPFSPNLTGIIPNARAYSGWAYSNPARIYEYAEEYAAGTRPPGDMVTATQGIWQVVNDFDHHL